jgi:hypothetical protein
MAWSNKGISLEAPPPLAWPIEGSCWRPFGDHYGWRGMFWLGCRFATARASCLLRSCREAAPRAETVTQLLKSPVTLWQSEPTLQSCCTDPRLSLRFIQRALDHSRVAARCKLSFERANCGPFGVVGVLFAPIAGKLADRRGPYAVIRLSAIAMPAVVDDQENLSTR